MAASTPLPAVLLGNLVREDFAGRWHRSTLPWLICIYLIYLDGKYGMLVTEGGVEGSTGSAILVLATSSHRVNVDLSH
jgi:hypothetical protein